MSDEIEIVSFELDEKHYVAVKSNDIMAIYVVILGDDDGSPNLKEIEDYQDPANERIFDKACECLMKRDIIMCKRCNEYI